MSHFSTIKTKIKEKPFLLKALEVLGHEVKQDQELVVGGTHGHNHPVVQADICIATDIGFRWCNDTQAYELVTDIETWSLPTPPRRFIDKVTQQYAKETILDTIKDQGFTVEEETSKVDNSIELTVTRWV
jgi:hypothetical protein